MKRLIVLFSSFCLVLVLVMSFILSACAPTAAPAPTQPAQPAYTPGATKPAATQPAKPAPTKPAPAPEAEVIKWRMQGSMTPGDPRWDLLSSTKWPELVETRTNGRMQVIPYTQGSLSKVPDMLEAVGGGMYEMWGNSYGGYWAGRIPAAFIEGTFLIENSWDARQLLWYFGFEDLMREVYAEANVFYLAGFPGGTSSGGVISNIPVRTIDDIGKIKLRAPGADWGFAWGKAGAELVFVSMGEIYTGLSLGTFDAALTSWASLYGMKCHEVTQYMMQPGLPTYINNLVVNLDTWNNLDADLQQILLSAGKEYGNHFTLITMEKDLYFRELMKEALEVVEMDAEAAAFIDEKALEVWDEHEGAGDPLFQEAAKMVKDFFAWKASGYNPELGPEEYYP